LNNMYKEYLTSKKLVEDTLKDYPQTRNSVGRPRLPIRSLI